MTEALMNLHRQAVEPLLAPGERLLDVATVVPVSGAKGIGDGTGAKVGNALARLGAVTGQSGSIASGFPSTDGTVMHRLLMVTDQRLAFVTSSVDRRKPGQVMWHAPRHLIQRIERRPRLQLMARFRLHFTDGSAVSLFTARRRTIESLATHLGR
ncbi:hypothetical protein [Streptomyces rubellomurinus]|uniref:YokE-like PH domain-containing protein n=2 Tax=Streptomyces TaxID=1883 RepID=A0A0F2TMR3_STRR3|nr:hypothetical protein [Streptomyces rubellomurinus]KJS63570.1 hypothetical protein VM95_01460 [Streptomyces rubellomurinus]